MYGINRYKGLPKVFFTSPFKGTVLSGDWRFSRDASSCSSFCFALRWLRSTWRRQKPFGNKVPHKILAQHRCWAASHKGLLLSEGNLRFFSPFRLTIICRVLGSANARNTKLWGLTRCDPCLWDVIGNAPLQPSHFGLLWTSASCETFNNWRPKFVGWKHVEITSESSKGFKHIYL